MKIVLGIGSHLRKEFGEKGDLDPLLRDGEGVTIKDMSLKIMMQSREAPIYPSL